MSDSTSKSLPLDGLRVLDFTHAVMGPSASMILADLGADVIHVEPPEGDSTRRLKGFGTGYFWFYNRNKKSLSVDIKSVEGEALLVAIEEPEVAGAKPLQPPGRVALWGLNVNDLGAEVRQ